MRKSPGFVGCLDRNSVYREAHELDKDGVCIFCDETPASAVVKARDRAHEAERHAAMVRGDRAWMAHERRMSEQIEDLADMATETIE